MRRMKSLLVIMLVILFACPAVWAKEFKIGVAVPLTGVFGKDGALVKDAYTLWAETVNTGGGIEVSGVRYPVSLIFYDDMSNPQTSARLVEKLVTQDKVDLLLGGFGSSQVMAASAVAERKQFPLISGAASANSLFERGFKYYFSTLGKATDEVRGAAEVFFKLNPLPRTAAIVGANIPFTALACEGFKKYVAEAGLELVHFELFPLKLQDYNTMLEKAKAKNPDLLLVGSHLAVAMRTIKAMKETGFSPKGVAFSYGPTVPDFVKNLGKDAEYVVAASEWTPNMAYQGPVFGKASDFHQAYLKRFGRAPDYVEAATAAGAVILQAAMQKLKVKPPVKDQDRVKIMEELHRLDMMTFYGRIHFGPHGDNVAHPPVAVQVQDGKLVNVYPPSAAESAPRYPMAPWGKR
jgi:branched-chain amino acid transport system substrate-binding protein